MIQTNTQGAARGTKALALGFLLATLLTAASLLLTAKPAHAATTFTVSLTSDEADSNVGDGRCDVSDSIPGNQCSLRAAIQQANATAGADIIDFNIVTGTAPA